MKLAALRLCSLALREPAKQLGSILRREPGDEAAKQLVHVPAGVSCHPVVSSPQHSVGADAQIHRATSALLPSALILCPSPRVESTIEILNNAHPTSLPLTYTVRRIPSIQHQKHAPIILFAKLLKVLYPPI